MASVSVRAADGYGSVRGEEEGMAMVMDERAGAGTAPHRTTRRGARFLLAMAASVACLAFYYLSTDPTWPELYLVSYHKSGFVFSERVYTILTRTHHVANVTWLYGWHGRLRLFPRRTGLSLRAPHAWSHVVAVVRDPFAMAISGMLYHRAGQECRADCCGSTNWTRGPGLAHLAATHADYGLPARGETAQYCEYLQSLNLSQALLAEMVRTRAPASDAYNMIAATRTIQAHPASMAAVCLEDLSDATSINDTIARVWRTFGLWPLRPDGLAALRALTGYSGNHSSRSGLSKQALAQLSVDAVRHDEAHFGGGFARDARDVGCSQAARDAAAASPALPIE